MKALTKKWFLLVTLFSLTYTLFAQEIDLMLKGGTVIDPKNKLNKQLDIAIDDGIIV
jgi:dihydroorotase